MEQNYNEQEIAEHYIGIIKSKREQGFTDEQIAKDIGFPLETVQRVNTNDTLPENPNEKEDDELPMEETGNESNSSEMDAESKNSESSSQNEKLDIREEYTLEQSAEDMFSDDSIKNLKAEFAQAKIRHSKLVAHIAAVMMKEEEDLMPVEMLQIKADALQTYLTVLGVQMNIVKNIEKDIEEHFNKEEE